MGFCRAQHIHRGHVRPVDVPLAGSLHERVLGIPRTALRLLARMPTRAAPAREAALNHAVATAGLDARRHRYDDFEGVPARARAARAR
jgi:hypothetical protein